MHWTPTICYAVCYVENNEIIHHIMHHSKAGMLLQYDTDSTHVKCIAVGWFEENNTESKLLWIEKQNIKCSKEEGIELLHKVYASLFAFDDEWSEDNC